MHWPVGPPTVYVAGSPQSTPKSTTTHHSSSSSHPKATNGEHFIENSQTTPNGVSGPGQHEDIAATSEAIVSINSGRKGSVFATITESTLTIWWARVRRSYWQFLLISLSNCLGFHVANMYSHRVCSHSPVAGGIWAKCPTISSPEFHRFYHSNVTELYLNILPCHRPIGLGIQ